jgi:hypothetical protein
MSIIISGAARFRPVGSAQSASANGAPPVRSDPLDIVIKLIPSEVITLYTTALAFEGVRESRTAQLTLLAVGLALTPSILFLVGRRTHQPVALAQYVVRTLAFAAWAFAIGNPLAPDKPIQAWIPGLAVLLLPLLGSLLFPAGQTDS